MKVVLKKFLISIVIVVTLLQFCVCDCTPVLAIEASNGYSFGETLNNVASNLIGGLVNFGLLGIKLPIMAFLLKMNFVLAAFCNDKDFTSVSSTIDSFILTPYDIFFNKIDVLDINFFNVDSGSDSIANNIKKSIAQWYQSMQILASSILLVVLIYIGIRMATSSLSVDKAKYKKMLADWVVSMIIMMLVHYIAVFILTINETIVDAIGTYAQNSMTVISIGSIKLNGSIDEAMILMAAESLVGFGWKSVSAFLVYCVLFFQILMYFIMYFNRVLKVGFLLIISPLITLTYSIDKIGDGKAQIFDNWLKEFIFTVFIQPFHCIIYITFVKVAFDLIGLKLDLSNIFKDLTSNDFAAGFLAIMCIKFIGSGEKAVRSIFAFSDDNSKTGQQAAVASMLAVTGKAGEAGKKIGAVASSGMGKKLMASGANAAKNLKNAKVLGKNLGDAASKLKDKKVVKAGAALGKGVSKGVSKGASVATKATKTFFSSSRAKKIAKMVQKNRLATNVGEKFGKKFTNTKMGQRAKFLKNSFLKNANPAAIAATMLSTAIAWGLDDDATVVTALSNGVAIGQFVGGLRDGRNTNKSEEEVTDMLAKDMVVADKLEKDKLVQSKQDAIKKRADVQKERKANADEKAKAQEELDRQRQMLDVYLASERADGEVVQTRLDSIKKQEEVVKSFDDKDKELEEEEEELTSEIKNIDSNIDKFDSKEARESRLEARRRIASAKKKEEDEGKETQECVNLHNQITARIAEIMAERRKAANKKEPNAVEREQMNQVAGELATVLIANMQRDNLTGDDLSGDGEDIDVNMDRLKEHESKILGAGGDQQLEGLMKQYQRELVSERLTTSAARADQFYFHSNSDSLLGDADRKNGYSQDAEQDT